MTNEKAVAEKLLQIGAVKINTKDPFTWASGWKSPVYCDNRRILSFPYIRDFIKTEMSNLIFEQFPEVSLLAGVATAGIAWGALVADQLKLPFIYVRPKPKDHGMQNQIEGFYQEGQKALVIEDLISTGKSSLQVIEVLKKEALEVLGTISIFNYGFSIADEAFNRAGVACKSLTNYRTLIEVALEKNAIQPEEQNILNEWRKDPENYFS